MIGELGRWSLIFALIIIIYGVVMNILGIKTKEQRFFKSSKNAVLALIGFVIMMLV